jgi:nitrate/TMAO reductase-like tetraheme cytochrome c subunit
MTSLRPVRALRAAWRRLRAGPGTYPFALVGALGIAVGVIGWGGFNTAMEATNTLGFCVSCHEMRSTVFEEYKTTVHYRNASGVRAICSDCHVPRDWTHKVVRKVQASAELRGDGFPQAAAEIGRGDAPGGNEGRQDLHRLPQGHRP